MAPSKVIRIDEEVWAELQRRARPLEDTPNSVLRRVFGLSEEATEQGMDRRVAELLELAQEKIGKRLILSPQKNGYALLSVTNEPVAFIRSHRQRIRLTASKQTAQDAGLTGWHRERAESIFSGESVRWYAPDGDEVAYREIAAVLAKLWRHSMRHR
jgi:hypothetical protein